MWISQLAQGFGEEHLVNGEDAMSPYAELARFISSH